MQHRGHGRERHGFFGELPVEAARVRRRRTRAIIKLRSKVPFLSLQTLQSLQQHSRKRRLAIFASLVKLMALGFYLYGSKRLGCTPPVPCSPCLQEERLPCIEPSVAAHHGHRMHSLWNSLEMGGAAGGGQQCCCQMQPPALSELPRRCEPYSNSMGSTLARHKDGQ